MCPRASWQGSSRACRPAATLPALKHANMPRIGHRTGHVAVAIEGRRLAARHHRRHRVQLAQRAQLVGHVPRKACAAHTVDGQEVAARRMRCPSTSPAAGSHLLCPAPRMACSAKAKGLARGIRSRACQSTLVCRTLPVIHESAEPQKGDLPIQWAARHCRAPDIQARTVGYHIGVRQLCVLDGLAHSCLWLEE